MERGNILMCKDSTFTYLHKTAKTITWESTNKDKTPATKTETKTKTKTKEDETKKDESADGGNE